MKQESSNILSMNNNGNGNVNDNLYGGDYSYCNYGYEAQKQVKKEGKNRVAADQVIKQGKRGDEGKVVEGVRLRAVELLDIIHETSQNDDTSVKYVKEETSNPQNIIK